MEKTLLVVVRHGETEWNVTKQLQGQQNSELTNLGKEQAEQTTEALRYNKFDALYTSNLKRSIETAQIVNQYHHLEILTDSSLAERNFGIMEGRTSKELQEEYPEIYSKYLSRETKYQIPGGESLESFFKRVKTGLNSIIEQNTGKRILIITHGGVLDCMIRIIFDYPLRAPRQFSIYNASINIISITRGTWFLEQWGSISHHKGSSLNLEIQKV